MSGFGIGLFQKFAHLSAIGAFIFKNRHKLTPCKLNYWQKYNSISSVDIKASKTLQHKQILYILYFFKKRLENNISSLGSLNPKKFF
jgi:hypothetical protein